jgi:acetoacetyl-CoA synthetase
VDDVNWLVSALSVKASIVLFDGSPMYQSEELLLKIANKEKVTLLGISANILKPLKKAKTNLRFKYALRK